MRSLLDALARDREPRRNGGRDLRGDAVADTRYQKLSPHPNGPSHEQVAAHQRGRLRRAMVEAVARDGYDAITVGRLCALAGVSKRAFYELFTGKPDCFELTYEYVTHRSARRLALACAVGEPGRQLLQDALGEFLQGVARQPESASFVLVHALDSTPAALERRERVVALFEQRIAACLPGGELLSPAIRRGIVAGVAEVTRARLLDGRASELPDLAGELADWAWSCAHAAAIAAWRVKTRERHAEPRAASGTRPERRRLHLVEPARNPEDRGESRLDRSPRGERRLLFESAIALAARAGVLALTPGALAADSGISSRRVNALFEGADQCLLEALRCLGEELLAGSALAGTGAESWQQAVRRSVAALLGGLVHAPALAQVMFMEALAVGPRAVALRSSLCARGARSLSLSVPAAHRPSAVACEASTGAVLGIVERHVVKGAVGRLPRLAAPACLLLLAPAMGAGVVHETERSENDPFARLTLVGA
ncbi:MAG TPA: TetR/AcrR family transcriptional regulator [Solirubrobacteraceae bacterium]|jgi:AcrR family transcriptional regulator|nr:TetR/AcrR family transcriptional regulator [Solirubrobacteraceae bacterium]